jgi:glycosyl hydrolase family 79
MLDGVQRSPRYVCLRLIVGMLAVAVVGLSVGACGAGSSAGGRSSLSAIASGAAGHASVARVEVAYRNHPLIVPRSFLGVSTEYWTIPVWARHMRLLRRVFSLIAQEGPVVLRIGGNSADQSIWSPRKELPEWVFELTPSWLAQTSAIVRQLHVKLILDLNLLSATPATASKWASTAERRLPRGSVIGFEIGNEPDIYNPASFRKITSGPTKLPSRLTAASYAAAYRTYDRALDRSVPGIPLFAPALAEPQKNLSWISTLLAGSHHGLTAITAHRYPLSACARSGPNVPTVARLLSERVTAGMAASVKPAVRLARRAHLPVRLSEFNSVTCGGTRGVSNTFATALWAPDALLELIHQGVRSAALHVRDNAINMAFSLTNRGLVAFPLLYGLITYAHTLGTDPQLLPARVQTTPGAHLKAWAVLDGKQLRILLINKSRSATSVSLTLPAIGPATVHRLTAASASATNHVTLDGQNLNSQAQWTGRAAPETVAPSRGKYPVHLPGISAAIVIAAARPGTT